VIGLLSAAALLLGAAGLAKVLTPAPAAAALAATRLPGAGLLGRELVVRLTGLAEVVIGVSVVVAGGRIAAALLAATFLLLAIVSWRMVSVAPGQDCGCFGRSGSTVSHWHTGVNLSFALVGLLAVLAPTVSLWTELSRQPWLGIPLAAGVVLLAWLSLLLMTVLPNLLQARARVATSR
jgi:hypothetical protein